MIAALFVKTDGAYFGVPGVDPWDEIRDARQYQGTFPVVAHPPPPASVGANFGRVNLSGLLGLANVKRKVTTAVVSLLRLHQCGDVVAFWNIRGRPMLGRISA